MTMPMQTSTEHVEFTIDSLTNDPSKTPMIDQVVEQEVKIKDEDGNYISHIMYVITDVRQGFGESPSFADDAYVTYKGMFLDGYSFDSNDQPTWFSGLSTVRGFTNYYRISREVHGKLTLTAMLHSMVLVLQL